MSDPQIPPPPAAPELVRRILRWLIIAALVLAFVALLLPIGMAILPLGLILILFVGLVFFAFGKLPPDWLACVDPKDVGKLGGAAWPLLIVLLLAFVALLLGPLGLLLAAAVFALLFGLGWAGIGPLAAFATVVRGLIQLIRLLPTLPAPIKLASDAMLEAAKAVELLRVGLNEAQSQVGNASTTIAGIGVPKITTNWSTQNVGLPDPPGGSIPVPILSVSQTTERPFDGTLTGHLNSVQAKLADASAAAETQRDRLKDVGLALKALHDLLPKPPGGSSP